MDGSFIPLPYGDGYTVASGEDVDPRHFAGLDQDNLNDDHARFREYSNMTGRWMSPDPYMGSYNFSNPQSFNRYAYVMDNPLAFSDPTGQQCFSVPGAAEYTILCTAFSTARTAIQTSTPWLAGAIPYIGWGIDVGLAIKDLAGGPRNHDGAPWQMAHPITTVPHSSPVLA